MTTLHEIQFLYAQAIVFTSKHTIFTTEKLFALVALKIDDSVYT